MLKEYLLKKTLDAAIDKAKKSLREADCRLVTSRDDIQESIEHHLKYVKNWAGEISFADLKKAKRTTDIFIDLDVFVYPRRLRIFQQEDIESIPIKDIFEHAAGHIILLGLPGAGKTTSMKRICQAILYEEDFHPDRFSFPLVIEFRHLNDYAKSADSSIIIDRLYNILGLKLSYPDELLIDDEADNRKAIKEKLVASLLDKLGVLLVLDGFDELAEVKHRQEAIKDISTLATHLDYSTMVVTSRTGDFVYNIDNTVQHEICPLNQEQISIFARKWLISDRAASDFLAKINESPFADTTIRPLTLAHLCAIYERVGKIPDKPKTVYRKIVNLLLEEWDQQRLVRRLSQYGKFEVDRKFEFLSHLAYILTTSIQKTLFTEDDLLVGYKEIYQDYDLESREAARIVSEIETHTGLLIQSGYKEFEFAHKSLQEYLTAEYLVKLPSIPSSVEILLKLPNELAITTTISSKPSEYFSELILYRLMKQKLSEGFIKAFLTRLLLEKPDFNTSSRVGVAFVILFTKLIESAGDPTNVYSLDDVISETEKLLRPALQKGSMHIIEQCYVTQHIHERTELDSIHRLIKKKGAVHQGLSNLPRIIYIRSSFLEKNM